MQEIITYVQFDPTELFPINRVPDYLPERSGRRFHESAIRKWATLGKNGIMLRTVQVGRALCTTKAWLTEFLAASMRGGN